MATVNVAHNTTVTSPKGAWQAGDTMGAIYLGDIGRRNSLGGGASIYGLGQDQYLNPGDDIDLQDTGDVLLSRTIGMLKVLSDMGVITIT